MLTNRQPTVMMALVRLAAVACSLLMLTILIVTQSQAAFSDTTANTGNNFSTGSVVISDDDANSAMFTASALTPSVPVVECITVTYSGTLTPASIRTYGTSSGALAPYIDATIEIGTGGSFGDCSTFVPSSTIYNGTLTNFSTTHTNWATGLATFTAPTNPTSATLRFTLDVQNLPAAQSQSATAAFTFEAQD